MEISVLKQTDYVSSTGITDNTTEFDSSIYIEYQDGLELLNINGIYERTGGDFKPPAYNQVDDPNYVLNDVVFKDSLVQYCTAPVDTVRKQPSTYASVDTSKDFSAWIERYVNLGAFDNGIEFTVGNTVHKLAPDSNSATGWVYTLTTTVITDPNWNPEVFSSSINYIRRDQSSGSILVRLQNVMAIPSGELTGSEPTPYTTVYTTTDDATSAFPAGTQVRCGKFEYYNSSLNDNYYGLQTEGQTSYVNVTTYYPVVTYNVTNDSIEELAFCHNSENCSEEWIPKFLIIDSGNLYARTGVADAPIETEDIGVPTFKEVEDLTEANGWGWTYIRPTNKFSPLDGKKYTYVETPSPVEYTVSSDVLFDTLAINGLIATTVEVTFLPSDGSAAIPMITMSPQMNRDEYMVLEDYPTTIIAYAPRGIIGSVHMKFLSAGSIRIGGITLGMKVDAGFTNLTFGNRFKDYSPYEKDQYGNILYIEGVKTNIYNGTVDIPLTNYDMTNRLMASIGGNTVILNGSDTVENEDADSVNFFSATMVVGRIRGFTLKTKLDNRKLSQMATYSFEIEENV